MRIRQFIAGFISMVMLLAVVPTFTLSVFAEGEGDWTTYRSADDYNCEEEGWTYTPAPGYEYTSEGFSLIPANYDRTTPFGTMQTKEKVSLKDGVYMELRVDEYAYGGEYGTADHWISFNLWDSQKIAPGNTTDYGQGWLSLTRTPGNGNAGAVQSFTSGSEGNGFWRHHGDVAITPMVDVDGKEIYTFEVSYDGSNYTVSICGVPVQGSADITNHLNDLDPNGEFYVGVSFHSGEADSTFKATILKFGHNVDDATVPTGTDRKEPEENLLYIAPTVDPSAVPENMPCLLLDATASSYRAPLMGQGVTAEPAHHDSLKLTFNQEYAYQQWIIKNSLSYEAQDFPVVALFIEDPQQVFEGGLLRYSTGKYTAADDEHFVEFSIYDDTCLYYGESKEFTLILLDMRELLDIEAYEDGWNGRIHSLRFDYRDLGVFYPPDPEWDYMYLLYAGVFRTVEEAVAYNLQYVDSHGSYIDRDPETEPPVTEESATQEVVTDEAVTERPVEPVTRPQSKPNTPVPAQTEQATRNLEDELNKAGYTVVNCGAVSGAATLTLLMGAVAAAVALKKRTE